MSHIFISYNKNDDYFVSRLINDLELQGFDTFSDRKLKPGDDYEKLLSEGLKNAKYILVTLSPDSLEASGVKRELDEGLSLEREGRTKVIPLLVRPCPPEKLKEMIGSKFYADFTDRYKSGFEELLSALSEERAERRLPPPKEGGGEGDDDEQIPPDAGEEDTPMPFYKNPRIIIALISGIVTLTVAYWQFVYKPAHQDSEMIFYTVRVTNSNTQQAIRGAKVTIDAKGLPSTLYTDANGVSPFSLDKSIETVHIIVEAANCETTDINEPLPKSGAKIIPIPLKCSGKTETETKPTRGPLGLTYDHNPTVDEVRSDIERIRSVSIEYSSRKCQQLVGKAVIRLNGAQLNGANAKDLLENGARPRIKGVQFSVNTIQDEVSYIIVCNE